MKYSSTFALIILFMIFATGCTFTASTIDSPQYTGKSLSLGVVGEAPNISHVRFTSISFDELEDYTKLSSNYDAVIIMKEHLEEAAESKYAKVYTNADIPFFFIESTKSHIPFVVEELSYEDVSDINNGMYATGYLPSDKGDRTWGYGLYNDKVNESNIKNAYSWIFTTIESIENGTYQ